VRATIPRYSFGGVELSCVDMDVALDAFFDLIAARQGGYIACTCTHGIVESQYDEQLRQILNRSRLTLPDGMPTVWVGRLKRMPVRRVTAPDFLEAVMRDPRARQVRHYFHGASSETIDRIMARAGAMLGKDAIAGGSSPAFRPAGAPEDAEVLARMAAARPDVIWVGLGLPKQEYWMAQYTSCFPSSLLLGVGAAFDWFAGVQPRAPKWLQRLGLEWLHRVASEPKRLWPRYRGVVPKALGIMLKEFAWPPLYPRK
jgi:N-acetylglucosaminyldiphosphoundecaprenol N-acetyl-beta-D-mannosaminyltransferase